MPRRVVVALTGDSIVEGDGVTTPSGMAGSVRTRLRELGYDSGAWGYVPAHGSAVFAGGSSVLAAPWTYTGPWSFLGMPPLFSSSRVSYTTTGAFGANGAAARTTVLGAQVSGALRGDRFGVLFARGPDAGRLSVSVDGVARIVDARLTRGVDGRGITWAAATGDRDAHRVVVAPASGGTLRFTGVIARRDVGRRRQLEVSQVARAATLAGDDLARPEREALDVLRPHVTLILFGTNEQGTLLAGGGGAADARFATALRTRGRMARRHHGVCAIVPPAHNERPHPIQDRVARVARRAARAAGCLYAPVLADVWRAGSIATGMTTDGIHPTAKGYRAMALRLAPLIVRLASRLGT